MHLHFEKSINAKTDCTILSMSWMGKVPDDLGTSEEEGWKLNRTHYYQEGWLATGNVRGILGVTFSTSTWKKNSEVPTRTNYNLRGHRAQITLVQWNEPYQKLASCDSSGIIFVWIKFEGRWSIELINDRSTPVTHFSWSHDGRMALICYQDGFVLVGSVAGQRYWSSMLNLDSTITCGIWTPDDTMVYFGTSNGQVIVMDVHGMMVSQVQLCVESPIGSMSWSCEKFKMEENDDGEPSTGSNFSVDRRRHFILAVSFRNGIIFLMRSYDDVSPITIHTGMQGIFMEWSNSGEVLAVAGTRPLESLDESGVRVHHYINSLAFYDHLGTRVLNVLIPHTQAPITALTWGHNDKRIFVATGKLIHVGWVSKRIASLQLLCRLAIYKSLSTETCVSHLPLPLPVRALISSLHTQTILSILPNPNTKDLREFVSHPPGGNLRLHCTMIRHEEESSQSPGTVYTLYLEYLGGLIPILKGKRTSKIRPEFVIFDPQTAEGAERPKSAIWPPVRRGTMDSERRHREEDLVDFTDSSESEEVELCASPRMQRKRHRNRQRERERERRLEAEREWEQMWNGLHVPPDVTSTPAQLVYNDVLPENLRLVEVTSNIWGTKFKINGLSLNLPENLGQVTYKTSLLHLQPRQMTLLITELRDDIFLSPDTQLGYLLNSQYQGEAEGEEEFSVLLGGDSGAADEFVIHHQEAPPIVPTNRCFLRSQDSQPEGRRLSKNPSEISVDSDEFPYVDLAPLPDLRNNAGYEFGSPGAFGSFQPLQINEKEIEVEIPPPVPARQNFQQRMIRNGLVTRAQIERIDEDKPSTSTTTNPSSSRTSIRMSPSKKPWNREVHGAMAAPIHVRRSMSASFLDNVRSAHQIPLDVVLGEVGAQQSPPKRLVLVKKPPPELISPENGKPRLKDCGKSKSWDSYDLSWWKSNSGKEAASCPKCSFPTTHKESLAKDLFTNTLTMRRSMKRNSRIPYKSSVNRPGPAEDSIERVEVVTNPSPNPTPPPPPVHRRSMGLLTPLLKRREMAANKRNPSSSSFIPPASPQHQPRSSPSTPNPPRKKKGGYLSSASSPFRQLFANSPLLSRRRNKNNKSQETQTIDISSDDEEGTSQSGHQVGPSTLALNYRSLPQTFNPFLFKDIETFQKNQLRQKLRNKKIHNVGNSMTVPRRREFLMHNKAPMWNENSQVYQLDFGGRVTQESAKNFQIEFRGKQVMQFGRIDTAGYTLDFQYPFSAIQAFAVALANVTQRLK